MPCIAIKQQTGHKSRFLYQTQSHKDACRSQETTDLKIAMSCGACDMSCSWAHKLIASDVLMSVPTLAATQHVAAATMSRFASVTVTVTACMPTRGHFRLLSPLHLLIMCAEPVSGRALCTPVLSGQPAPDAHCDTTWAGPGCCALYTISGYSTFQSCIKMHALLSALTVSTSPH